MVIISGPQLLVLAVFTPLSIAFLSTNRQTPRIYFDSSSMVAPEHSSAPPSQFHEVKAIIFDVDGTLADSGNLGYTASLELLKKHELPTITYDEYCEHTRYTTPDRLARHAGLEPGTNEFYNQGAVLAKEFDNLYIDRVSLETAAFFPGIMDLIRSVPPTTKVAALTNAACRYAHAVLTVNDEDQKWLYRRFSSIHGADDVPKPKPHPDGLLMICSELGVSADECVYIGDSPSDGEAAKAAGMPSIGVGWGAHDIHRLAANFDATVESVDQLRHLLVASL